MELFEFYNNIFLKTFSLIKKCLFYLFIKFNKDSVRELFFKCSYCKSNKVILFYIIF